MAFAAALMMVGCSDSSPSAPDGGLTTNPGSVQEDPVETPTPGVEVYRSVMSGDEEVPAVATRASGSVSFHMSSDGTAIVYAITVGQIVDVTDAHIHVGARGEVGPPVVDLLHETMSGEYNGLLAQGRITASSLVGPLAGMTLADLHALLTSGRAYVNVHTVQHPAGEIRGQVTTVPGQDEDDA